MKRIIVLFLLCTALVQAFAQTPLTPFKDGDRAVFLGNSITDGGHYHSYIWLYYMTRFPYMDNLRIINAGISGERAVDMNERLDADVFDKKPTVLMVSFGMNDTGYAEYNQEGADVYAKTVYDICKTNFEAMQQRLCGLDNVKVVMVGGFPYDETSKIQTVVYKGKNAVMNKVVQMQKDAAAEHGWGFVDFSAPMTEAALRVQAEDPMFSLSFGDRVHPDNDGNMMMAYLFLKAQGLSGKKVADMDINASAAKAITTENCTVSNISKTRKGISFDYLAESLPYPLDTLHRGLGSRPQSMVDRLVPFTEEMNQERLKVTGLKGEHDLYIDGQFLGSWSAEQFAEGINLAELTWTPQYQQALEVMYLNEMRWEIERSLRDYAWVQYGILQRKGLVDSDDKRAIDAIDEAMPYDIYVRPYRNGYAMMMHKNIREVRKAEMELIIDKIYQINKPVTRKISIVKK